ncbi:hypothetical protein [Candidatus Berkiella aquae]|uniref:Uncharacterized protein n=1 Tax=Candidatus Berkiella aquae TaxID=295108 RepID=A0A0Q9YRG6_9GAMM|nr:hypothetical protein [Candidatus Berkiella aquae]MCS5712146.1 hypothetical protein [Candidatus Berkiella aquae]
MPDYAQAGAYRNNCAFHCMTHTLFNMSDEKLHDLFNKNPIFTDLLIKFYDYYELGQNYDVDDFLSLVNRFSHPEDKEIAFGEVMRKLLREMIDNSPDSSPAHKEELKAGNLISDELVGKLANAMGASLTIHLTDEAPDFDVKFPIAHPQWEVNLYHTERGGGHYNFSYKEPFFNQFHNEQYSAYDEYSQRHPRGASLLYEAENVVGVKEQEQSIKNIIQNEYKSVIDRRYSNRNSPG